MQVKSVCVFWCLNKDLIGVRVGDKLVLHTRSSSHVYYIEMVRRERSEKK